MDLKHKAFRQFTAVAGYDFARFPRRMKLLDTYSIDTVLDIGANDGQYVRWMRDYLGFRGKALSFEPLSSAFELLKATAEGDPEWDAFNVGLGDTEGTQEIHIAANSQSSSLLDMLPAHLESAPESEYIGTETIEVKRLDSVFEDLCGTSGNVYMKIDTQGFVLEKSQLDFHLICQELGGVPQNFCLKARLFIGFNIHKMIYFAV